jgi:hypothetical protein
MRFHFIINLHTAQTLDLTIPRMCCSRLLRSLNRPCGVVPPQSHKTVQPGLKIALSHILDRSRGRRPATHFYEPVVARRAMANC